MEDFSISLVAPELSQMYMSPDFVPVRQLSEDSEDVPRAVFASSTNVANKLAVGLVPTFMDKVKDTLGAAQTAVVSPVQTFAKSTAKAAGASDDTAQDVSGWFLPVVLVIAGVVVVVMMVKGGVFGRKSIKL